MVEAVPQVENVPRKRQVVTKEFSLIATDAKGTVVVIGEIKATVIERRHVLIVRRPM
jgi:hypothetical protein